ncbi:MAG: SDR family NAD(P)-dependent oxidoreductase, partial [Steroidobacteraceae bacterium]
VRHLRNTIRFVDGVKLLLEDASRVYLEVGPGTILGSFVRQSHAAVVQRVLASLRHPEDATADEVYFRTVAGRLWALGLPLADELLWTHAAPLVPLPAYAFQHERYWIEPSSPEVGIQAEEYLHPDALPFGNDWLTGPRWIQQGIPESEALLPQLWCVFHHHDALARTCIDALRRRGHQVIEVIGGDTFARIDDDTFTLAPEVGAAAYDELLQTLVNENRVPDRVLHTWLLTRSKSFRPGQSFLHRNQIHGFYSLFYLARAFAKRAEGKACHWIVAGNGVVSVGGEPLLYPEKATVLGACAVIPRELKGVTCAYVDVALPADTAAAAVGESASHTAYGVLQELGAPPANATLAWRNRVRWMRYLAPHHPKAAGRPARIREGGTYLITGGFGGIAGAVADWLARDFRARIILLSRTPLPQRDNWDEWLQDNPGGSAQSSAIRRVRKLEALGGSVLVVSADVAVQEQLEEAVASAKAHFGDIHGVFHTAGLLRDGLIALKSERDIEEVFAAKLYGTLLLDTVLRTEPMDFMLLFSSISTFTAPVGQIDYVAANTFLNAFAEACRGQRPYPVVALNWGIWNEVGMASMLDGGRANEGVQDVQPGRLEPVHYPLFNERRSYKDGRAQLHRFTGTLSAKRSWITDDHRLRSGQSLVPGSGYLELIRAALAEIGETQLPWKASAVRFIEPFYVHETDERDFRIQLRGTPGQWHFELDVQQGETGALAWRSVATARITTAQAAAPKALDLAALVSRCNASIQVALGEASLRTRQEAHLLFGPRWHVLHSIQLGQREALAKLNLAPDFQQDLETYPLHPGLLDVATGCAMDLIPGYQQQDVPTHLWVPVGYDSFQCHAPLTAALVSWIRLAQEDDGTGTIQFDVVLTDTAGRVLATAKGLTLRRIEGQLQAHDAKGVKTAALEHSASPRKTGPAEQALAHNLARGIRNEQGIDIIQRVLASVDRPVVLASSMDPRDLVKQADAVARISRTDSVTKFARPKLETTFEAPRDEIERALAEIWGRLLGVEGIGIRDSFFALGGHSLIAVRLFNEVSDRFNIDLPMSALIQTPDVAGLAEKVRGGPVGVSGSADTQRARIIEEPFQYVVPMVSGPAGGGAPLFVVAGMFGNVLNLSHLAHLTGEDRAFFAIQARGLLGGDSPHESFEEAARDYLHEVRRIQPEGPYILGGYSGGGLIAFEMARQLEQAGEQVDALLLLDTPIREAQRLSLFNKIELWLPGLRKEGLRFLQRKLREKREWRRELEEREEERRSEGARSAQFHSQRVGDAFIRALTRYEVHRSEVSATLFRPRLKVKYRLRDGRLLDAGREILRPDNGWTSHVRALAIVEVPGN